MMFHALDRGVYSDNLLSVMEEREKEGYRLITVTYNDRLHTNTLFWIYDEKIAAVMEVAEGAKP